MFKISEQERGDRFRSDEYGRQHTFQLLVAAKFKAFLDVRFIRLNASYRLVWFAEMIHWQRTQLQYPFKLLGKCRMEHSAKTCEAFQ